jgi:ornithine--oxo-acid transaminase
VLVDPLERHGARNYHPLPVTLVRGEGAYAWDAGGRRYLDMLSAYSALNHGHRHPRILAAAAAQMERITLTSRAFRDDQLGPFLGALSAVTGLPRALPMNTGAEAVETGLKAMRKWAYQHKGVPVDAAEIIVAENNFHGRTTTIVSFSTEEQYRLGFGPFTPGFRVVPFGDLGAAAAAMTPRTAGILVEPIQGEAGVVVPPAGYLRGLRALCDEQHACLVVDEIQTGMGRTGVTWAHQHDGIVPDGLCVGKALGGGVYPVSAFCASEGLMGVFSPGDHGSTFGGNALAAAIGAESLRVLQEERLAERAAELGAWFIGALRGIGSSRVAEVRGRGLLIGVELREPARPVAEALLGRGLLCKDTHGTVLRFAPPLVVQRADLESALESVAAVLS